MLARLAHLTARHRKAIILAWLALTVFGGFAAGQVSQRWLQSFSIPGYSAYEASQRTLERFGTGERPPNVVVFQTKGDATKSDAIRARDGASARGEPGCPSQLVLLDGQRRVRLEGQAHDLHGGLPGRRAGVRQEERRRGDAEGRGDGTAAGNDGPRDGPRSDHGGERERRDGWSERPRRGADRRPRRARSSCSSSSGRCRRSLLPLAIAVSSILNTFTLVWILTYVTDVSIIVQFLIALVGLGVAIDYALLMIFRFRDELREGKDVETALVETMTHAGKAVIVSGSTVAVGLLSLIVLPSRSSARSASAEC